MGMMINFTVDGKPIGKGRPRFARRGAFVQTYTPKATMSWEEVIREASRIAMGSTMPLETSVALSVRVYMPIPVSWSAKKKAQAIACDIRPGKPDLDNHIKCVMDAGNGILWVDDSLVCELHSMKCYATHPHLEITVAELLP
jgi:Holliday junction resolvase RusA-like endonuclease